MKTVRIRLTLALILQVTTSIALYSQTEITIGGETGNYGQVFPTDIGYFKSYTQQIYLQPEINQQGVITAISFDFAGSYSFPNSDTWTIHFGHTNKSVFESNTDWIDYGGLTQVFSGQIPSNPAAGWSQIILDEPYFYNNGENLVIAVLQNKSGWDVEDANCFGSYSSGTEQKGIYVRTWYSATPNIDPSNPTISNDYPDFTMGTSENTNRIKLLLSGSSECMLPTNLTASNITNNQAILNWTENGTATNWEIEFGAAGFIQGSGIILSSIVDNPFTLSELSQNTDYDFYVRSVCDDDVFSEWAGPYNFTTLCAFEIPYFEGFESGYITNTDIGSSNNNPCIYNQSELGTNNWRTNNGAPYPIAFEGSWNANLYHNNTDWLFIPIDFQADALYSFSIFAKRNSSSATLEVKYGPAPNSASMTSGTVLSSSSVGASYSEFTGTFQTVEAGIYYIGIRGSIPNSTNYLSIDNISITQITCPYPSNLSASDITPNSAKLTWTAAISEPAEGYEYYYSVFDIEPTEMSLPSGSFVAGTTEVTINNLSANKRYYFWIRSVCNEANSEFSDWAGYGTFKTACGFADVPFFEGFEDGFVNNGTIAGCYSQEHAAGTVRSWDTYSGASAYQGNFHAALYHSTQRWLFIPVNLKADIEYNISLFANGIGNISVFSGISNNAAEMTNEIISASALTSTYSEFTQVFTVPQNGDYYIGILGNNTSGSSYLRIDNFDIRKIPTASISGGGTVCQFNESPVITITNHEDLNVSVTYNFNIGSNQHIELSAGEEYELQIPTEMSGENIVYLSEVRYLDYPSCITPLSESTSVFVDQAPMVGSISENQSIFAGDYAADISLSDATGQMQWQYCNDSEFSSDVEDVGTNSLVLTSAEIGLLSATSYFRAVVSNGMCEPAISDVHTVFVETPVILAYFTVTDQFSNPIEGADIYISGTGHIYSNSEGEIWQVLEAGNYNYDVFADGFYPLTSQTFQIIDQDVYINVMLSPDISSTLGVNTKPINIFPNPFTDYLYIDNLCKSSSIIIKNSLGQIVFESITDTQTNISLALSELMQGIYFIQIKNSESEPRTLKILKQ